MPIDLARIAELLEEGSGPRPDWSTTVRPYTQPFLEAIAKEFANLVPGQQLEFSNNRGTATKSLNTLQEAKYQVPGVRIGGTPYKSWTLRLKVLIGSANQPGGKDLWKSVIWGISWWGREDLAGKIADAYRHIGLGRQFPDFVIETSRPRAFGGRNATGYRAIGIDQLRNADAARLSREIANDLAALLQEIQDKRDQFLKFIGGNEPANGGDVSPIVETGVVARTKSLVEQFRQVILYGPPGTGKTRLARQVALSLLDSNVQSDVLQDNGRVSKALEAFSSNSGRFHLVVFHPSYEYEQFIGGITAKATSDGNMSYAVEEGVFLRMCAASRGVLVIDEINRGNLSKLFGELVYALEYRGSPVTLTFQRQDGAEADRRILRIPRDLFVIATMNSSDRSIGHIDVAIRRRFALIPVHPDVDVVIEVWRGRFGSDGERFGKALSSLMTQANRALAAGAQEGMELGIGQSYFLPRDEDQSLDEAREVMRSRWEYQVRPLLVEYEVMTGLQLTEYAKPLDEVLAVQPQQVSTP